MYLINAKKVYEKVTLKKDLKFSSNPLKFI